MRIHPFDENPRHTYQQIIAKLLSWYGIKNAEHWYAIERKRIADQCLPDRWGMLRHETIAQLWENRQMESKWKKDEVPGGVAPGSVHCVEIYAVRAPGAGGELGVLTTAHEIDLFVAGLASASAKYIASYAGDASRIERDLHWILKNALPLAFRLAGYKADQVVERHVLMCGSSAPSADDIVATS